jgi:hypothetical protein
MLVSISVVSPGAAGTTGGGPNVGGMDRRRTMRSFTLESKPGPRLTWPLYVALRRGVEEERSEAYDYLYGHLTEYREDLEAARRSEEDETDNPFLRRELPSA